MAATDQLEHSKGIRQEEILNCLLCLEPGVTIYEGLSDPFFGVPGLWGFLGCDRCRLMWLNPRPTMEAIAAIYSNYYTHEAVGERILGRAKERIKRGLYSTADGYGAVADGWIWHWLGVLLTRLLPLQDAARLGTLCLEGPSRGKLLDVGCGSGHFLYLMQKVGWRVEGVEPDPAASEIARRNYGISVRTTTLEEASLPSQSYEAITLHHSLEHVHNPETVLSECRRLLKPNGRLVVVTPNIESLGHQLFGQSWAHLDSPRHLWLFSRASLTALAERAGFGVEMIRTSARTAGWVWTVSRAIRNRRGVSSAAQDWLKRVFGLPFQIREEQALRANALAGEELVMISIPRT